MLTLFQDVLNLKQETGRTVICPDCIPEDKFLEETDALNEAKKFSDNLYKEKITPFYSQIYTEIKTKDLAFAAANLYRKGEKSERALRKINAIINNVPDGQQKLKGNGLIQAATKVLLNLNKSDPGTRVNAAKIATRLSDIPTTLQITSENPEKEPKNVDSYIVLPRTQRIFRQDKYIENYKAGNWDV